MSENLFKKYGNRQVGIVELWVEQNPWLKEKTTKIVEDSTSFHDVLITVDGFEYSVEVKEDELYWYERTGNVGLDVISTFKYKDGVKPWDLWISAKDYDDFCEDITVGKWGKLYTCDAHIQLFHVENTLLIGYNNKMITSKDFQEHMKKRYRLRINDKKAYGLKDHWMSASYMLKPLPFKDSKSNYHPADFKFRQMQITNLKELKATQ